MRTTGLQHLIDLRFPSTILTGFMLRSKTFKPLCSSNCSTSALPALPLASSQFPAWVCCSVETPMVYHHALHALKAFGSIWLSFPISHKDITKKTLLKIGSSACFTGILYLMKYLHNIVPSNRKCHHIP